MADQTRKPKPKKDEAEKTTDPSKTKSDESSEMEELLDEIDEVLEANAEDFVRSYVQKGGQAVRRKIAPPPRLWGFAST